MIACMGRGTKGSMAYLTCILISYPTTTLTQPTPRYTSFKCISTHSIIPICIWVDMSKGSVGYEYGGICASWVCRKE